jgi:predicted O-methyltransferase YrrM
MNDILKGIPDKRQDKDTTSLKFKEDLIEFFGENWKDKTCLEIGTNRGYTTRILSSLFKKVITCEYDWDLLQFAKDINKDRNNIDFVQKDVYRSEWDFGNIDVVFIDCVHEYENVMHDIHKSIQLTKPNGELILIFDDYGLPKPPGRLKDVKDAVDQYLEEHPSFELVKYVGEDKGSDCRPGKILKAEEGIICKFTTNKVYKNLVFMLDIDLGGDGRYSSARRSAYKYSIASWQKWCEKNNSELFVLNDLVVEKEKMAICWQRYYLFDILDANNINCDQVLMVDTDTIVHPDCPNFFEMSDNKYVGVHNEGSYDWIFRSIENYSKHIFDGQMIEWWKYINGGFQIVNNTHRQFFQNIINFYFTNQDNLIKLQDTYHTGTDQTPLNFLIQSQNIDLKLLPYEFNMCDLSRKEILGDDMLFTKIGWVYHFNAIPNQKEHNITNHYLEKTYKHFHGDLV